jgi:hypothetical protein
LCGPWWSARPPGGAGAGWAGSTAEWTGRSVNEAFKATETGEAIKPVLVF